MEFAAISSSPNFTVFYDNPTTGDVMVVRGGHLEVKTKVFRDIVVNDCTQDDFGTDYRYGFNGQVKDNELKGIGNSLDFGARMLDTRLGRWLSLDSLAKKYPSFSEYSFCGNSPLWLVDADGRDIYIYGSQSVNAVLALQKNTTLNVSFDANTNKITFSGKPVTKLDKELLNASTHQQINVNLYATEAEAYFPQNGGQKSAILIGGADGSTIDATTNKINAIQYYNYDQSVKAEAAGLSNTGTDVTHEILEAFFFAQSAPGTQQGSNDPAWGNAHKKAANLDSKFINLSPSLNPTTGDVGLFDKKSQKGVTLFNQSGLLRTTSPIIESGFKPKIPQGLLNTLPNVKKLKMP